MKKPSSLAKTRHIKTPPHIESIPYQRTRQELGLQRRRVRLETLEALAPHHPLEPGVIETDILSDHYREKERYLEILRRFGRIIFDHADADYKKCWTLLARNLRGYINSLQIDDTLLHQFAKPQSPCPYRRILVMSAETKERVWQIWCINFGFSEGGRLHPVPTPVHVHSAMSDNNFSHLYEPGQPFGYDRSFELMGLNGKPLIDRHGRIQEWGLCGPDGKPRLTKIGVRELGVHEMTAGKIYSEDDYEDIPLHSHPLTESKVNLNTVRYPHRILSAGHSMNIYGAKKPDSADCTLVNERS